MQWAVIYEVDCEFRFEIFDAESKEHALTKTLKSSEYMSISYLNNPSELDQAYLVPFENMTDLMPMILRQNEDNIGKEIERKEAEELALYEKLKKKFEPK